VELFGAMRSVVGRALLALVLVLTQLHFCESTYVRGTGSVCLECLAIEDHGLCVGENAGSHGDCHDCCEIQACETPQTFETPAPSHQFAFDFAILADLIVLPQVAEISAPWNAFPFSCGARATGPPSVYPSRGPPAHLFVHLSAGRIVEFLA